MKIFKSDIFSLAQGSGLSQNIDRILTNSGIRENSWAKLRLLIIRRVALRESERSSPTIKNILKLSGFSSL